MIMPVMFNPIPASCTLKEYSKNKHSPAMLGLGFTIRPKILQEQRQDSRMMVEFSTRFDPTDQDQLYPHRSDIRSDSCPVELGRLRCPVDLSE